MVEVEQMAMFPSVAQNRLDEATAIIGYFLDWADTMPRGELGGFPHLFRQFVSGGVTGFEKELEA